MERVCEECHHNLKEFQALCPECGTPIPEFGKKLNTRTLGADRQPLSLKIKVLISLTSVFVLSAIGFHLVLNWLTNESWQINRIYNAIVAEDVEALFEELVINDQIYNKTGFVEGLQSSADIEFYNTLEEVAKRVRKTGLTESVYDNTGVEVFRISCDSIYYIYSKLSMEPIGKKVIVDTDLTNASIEFAGEQFQLLGKPFVIGSALPGEYQIRLKGSSPYHTSEGDITIHWQDFEDDEITLPIDSSSYEVDFVKGFEEDVLSVAGKSTGKTIQEIGKLNPVFEESLKLTALRKMKDGSIEESYQVEAYPGKKISFTYPFLENQKEREKREREEQKKKEKKERIETEKEIQQKKDAEKINLASESYFKFRNSYEDALNYQDFNRIYHTLAEGSPAFSELEKVIREETHYLYEYEFVSNTVSEGVVEGDAIRLSVREIFNFINESGEVITYDRLKEYVMKEVEPKVYKLWEVDILDTGKSKS
ncbi:TcaA NTF2-like domain-containing protein [Bhargavaea massiliensis]|uniref:TcaA NTF2-like domain-containing protein n=1 Tax=Bhargavaea massiliensis TaxID=2697500 RepID=UPI001BD1B4D9|nr:hypothetical protein [Bhargavaea massiliensis]